jgi:hypothetical protein
MRYSSLHALLTLLVPLVLLAMPAPAQAPASGGREGTVPIVMELTGMR